MPQMMPINWIFSFLLCLIIFIVFISMNFYIFNYKMNYKFNKNFFNKPQNKIWKW